MRIAVFPGSFDPITIGHVDIVYKALPLFDRFIIAIGTNTQKKSLYSLEDRMQWIRDVFEGEPKIVVDFFDGLTAEYAQKISADYLVFISSPEVAHISSTIVREIISGGGDASPFIPKEVHLKIR